MDESTKVFIGVDFGTSGCRAACLNQAGELISESSVPYGSDAGPAEWRKALGEVVTQLPSRSSAAAISLSLWRQRSIEEPAQTDN
eukprot:g7284.t1